MWQRTLSNTNPMVKMVKATKEHAGLIAEIGRKSFLESHGNSAAAKDIDSFILKTYTKENISKEFENPMVYYTIILFDDKVAGFSKIELGHPNENIGDPNITKLDRLYLLKEYYGQKLGSQLVDYTIGISKKQNQKGIWLAVWVKNQRAMGFYKRTGFEIVGKHDFKISETHSNPNHIMYLKY